MPLMLKEFQLLTMPTMQQAMGRQEGMLLVRVVILCMLVVHLTSPHLLEVLHHKKDHSMHPDDASFRSSTDVQQLPVLSNPAWASGGGKQMCRFNMRGCHFANAGKCMYWHDMLSPLRPGQMSIEATDQHLNPTNVRTIERDHLWAAAFMDTQRKQILYAQDIFQRGAVSPQGIVWFQSRKDAIDALARTVAIVGAIEQGLVGRAAAARKILLTKLWTSR